MTVRSDESPVGSSPRPFEVVFVCTGNRARSPFAAELLGRHALGTSVSASSVGAVDVGPVPALPEAIRAAEMHGVDLASHRARHLAPGSLATANLIIGFEPFHVASAVVEGGAAKERAFLITELVEILDSMPRSSDATPERSAEEVIELAHSWRVRAPLFPRPTADPVGGSNEVFRTTFEQINDLVEAIASCLIDTSDRWDEI